MPRTLEQLEETDRGGPRIATGTLPPDGGNRDQPQGEGRCGCFLLILLIATLLAIWYFWPR